MRGAGFSNQTALALLLIGSVGGALGSGAVGMWLGRRARPVTPPSAPVAAVPSAVPTRPPAAVPDAGAQRVDGGVGDASVTVCVEVRDSGDRPVAAALVSARPMPTVASSIAAKPGADPGVGELGVYPGPLPFPEDIVAGTYAPLGRVGAGAAAAAAAAGPGTPKTDDKGRVCLRLGPPSHMQITAVREDRSASVELWLPTAGRAARAEAEGAATALTVVLRLTEPLDALCRLTTPAPLPAADESVEAVSDTVGPEVTGRVVDGRGFGLATVRVEGQVGRSRIVGVSDSSGSFKLSGLPRGVLSLRAQLGGYAVASLSRRADEPRSELQLTLRPGGGIAGTLRDGRRGGLPSGAQLTLVSAGDQAALTIPLGSDGSFSITGLPVGPATLRARAPGYGPLSRAINIPASDSPSQVSLRDLRLELEAGASLVGQVRGPTGAAAGVTILVLDDSGALVGKTLTDEHGDFRLADLPAGHVRITAAAASGQGRAETTVDLRSTGEERTYLELR